MQEKNETYKGMEEKNQTSENKNQLILLIFLCLLLSVIFSGLIYYVKIIRKRKVKITIDRAHKYYDKSNSILIKIDSMSKIQFPEFNKINLIEEKIQLNNFKIEKLKRSKTLNNKFNNRINPQEEINKINGIIKIMEKDNCFDKAKFIKKSQSSFFLKKNFEDKNSKNINFPSINSKNNIVSKIRHKFPREDLNKKNINKVLSELDTTNEAWKISDIIQLNKLKNKEQNIFKTADLRNTQGININRKIIKKNDLIYFSKKKIYQNNIGEKYEKEIENKEIKKFEDYSKNNILFNNFAIKNADENLHKNKYDFTYYNNKSLILTKVNEKNLKFENDCMGGLENGIFFEKKNKSLDTDLIDMIYFDKIENKIKNEEEFEEIILNNLEKSFDEKVKTMENEINNEKIYNANNDKKVNHILNSLAENNIDIDKQHIKEIDLKNNYI